MHRPVCLESQCFPPDRICLNQESGPAAPKLQQQRVAVQHEVVRPRLQEEAALEAAEENGVQPDVLAVLAVAALCQIRQPAHSDIMVVSNY